VCEEQFSYLLAKVKPHITKLDTIMIEPLPADLKLQITLRYQATGNLFSTLQHMYLVPKTIISRFIPEVLAAISESLKEYTEVRKC
jgi:hypothetical protein